MAGSRPGPKRGNPSSYDAVVVGAGPAGSAAALSLARSGVAVLLLDRADFPRWKVCGACLGPAAMTLLAELGLADRVRAAGAVPLDAMVLRAGSRRARIPLQGTVALSRGALDALLAEAVTHAGGEVRFGVSVQDVRRRDGGVELRARVDGEERSIQAGTVVDASGLGGLTVEGDGPRESVAEASRIGLGAVFDADGSHAVPPGELRMVVHHDGYVGMVRTEDGSLNVAAAVDRAAVARGGPGAAVDRMLASAGCLLPDVEPRLGWRGTPALTRAPVRAGRGRVLRVGDAAGYVEPFTGEGMGWALSAGVAVAPFALRSLRADGEGSAEEWHGARRRTIGRRQRLCHALAAGLRRPRVVQLAVGVLGVLPGLARPLVRSTAGVPDEVLAAAAGTPPTAGTSTTVLSPATTGPP